MIIYQTSVQEFDIDDNKNTIDAVCVDFENDVFLHTDKNDALKKHDELVKIYADDELYYVDDVEIVEKDTEDKFYKITYVTHKQGDVISKFVIDTTARTIK